MHHASELSQLNARVTLLLQKSAGQPQLVAINARLAFVHAEVIAPLLLTAYLPSYRPVLDSITMYCNEVESSILH